MESTLPEFRRARPHDLKHLVELQNENSVLVNAKLDKSDGFLSSAFSEKGFAAINQDVAIIVCTESSGIIQDDHDGTTRSYGATDLLGFVCASTLTFNKTAGLPAAMMARFPQVTVDGKVLSDTPCVITGPVCVARKSRGKGIFESLYESLWKELALLYPGKFKVAVALVSTTNPRSLAAHQKIGMRIVDAFTYKDKHYNTIAMQL